MAHSSAFCHDQEALQRDRAARTKLENVRVIAIRAANAWAQEARLAERREGKVCVEAALPPAPSNAGKEDDRQFSENPDRGFAT